MIGLAESFNVPLAFVDIETTGGSYRFARVLEVGVVRVENGLVVKQYQTLLHPGHPIPRWITELTGITDGHVREAPQFYEIAQELAEVLEGAVFVAHNVHFDYNFIKREYERLGVPFRPKLLCTVRLSRKLYPEMRRHNLESVIARLGVRPERRHRALDDAKVLWEFCQRVSQDFEPEVIDLAVKGLIKTPSVPKQLEWDVIAGLPKGPGVYIFKDAMGEVIYVGKSVSVRDRVKSHFSQFHSDAKEARISQQVASIEVIETCGELGALLTESELIKKYMPLHNRALQKKEVLVVARRILDEDGYMRVKVEELGAINLDIVIDILGIYRTRGSAKRFILDVAHNFYLCHKLVGLEKAKSHCFRQQLKRCFGACVGGESALTYNARFDQAFAATSVDEWPYEGPVEVEEISGDGLKEIITIYRWCVVGRRVEGKQSELADQSGSFDLDVYRIVRSYLRSGKATLSLAAVSS